jgi:hypothetical protein
MEFPSVASGSLEESVAHLERYLEYLESVKEKVPREAYSFAAADWHYNPNDPRYPHDGHIELTYAKVQSHLFVRLRKREYPMRPGKGHGEWMIDEVRLSDLGYVVHEVEFSRGTAIG